LDPDLPKKETKKIIVSLSDAENVDSMAVPTATGWKITIDTKVEAPTKEDVYQTLVHEITHISQSMNGFLGYELLVSMEAARDLRKKYQEDLRTAPRKTKQTIRKIMEHRHPTKATEHEARLAELIYLLQKNQFAPALRYLYQEAEYYQNFDFRTLAKKATSLGVTREQLEGFRQYAQEQIDAKFEELYSYAQQNTATTGLGRNLFPALETVQALAPLLNLSVEPQRALAKQYYESLTPEQRERDYLTNWKYIQQLVGVAADARQAASLGEGFVGYHATTREGAANLLKNQTFDWNKLQKRDTGFYGKGFYLADTLKGAYNYTGILLKVTLQPGSRIFDGLDGKPNLWWAKPNATPPSYHQEFADYYWQKVMDYRHDAARADAAVQDLTPGTPEFHYLSMNYPSYITDWLRETDQADAVQWGPEVVVVNQDAIASIRRVAPPRAQKTASPLSDEGFIGQRWGSQGAGLLLTTGEKVLLLLRSGEVEEPGTWGLAGGAVRRDDRNGKFQDVKQAALQESQEEMGTVPPHRIVGQYAYQEPNFQYTTFIGQVAPKVAETWQPRLNWENDDYGWFSPEELKDLPLHFGATALLADKFDLVFSGQRRVARRAATSLPSLDALLASLPPELLEKRRQSLLEDAEKYKAFKAPTEAEIVREAKKQVMQQNPGLVKRVKQRRDPNDRTRALVEIDNAVDNLYPDVEEALLAQRQETAIRTAFERLYEEAVENLQGEEGVDCFRVMSLPAGQDPTTLQTLGVYWAHDESGAGEYFADDEQTRKQRGGITVMYRARVDVKNIDVVGTLAANLVDPQEAEVRFKSGAKIFVYDVFCLDGKCVDAGINDWRIC
jgi:8-oxo-dGTP pyrophosphatase MutT (NUDIX family)